MGTLGRELMIDALRATVHDGDTNAVEDIVKFCNDLRVVLHVTAATILLLSQKRDY